MVQKVFFVVTEISGMSQFMVREMAQQLGVYTAIAEVLSSILMSNYSHLPVTPTLGTIDARALGTCTHMHLPNPN